LNVDFSRGSPVPTGGLSYDGGTGSNALVVDESARTTPDTVEVTNGTIASTGVPYMITYLATGGTFARAVTLPPGPAQDTVYGRSTRADAVTTVNAGAGDDRIEVGDAANLLTGIRGTLNVHGQDGLNDMLNVHDDGWTGGDYYILTDTGVQVPSILSMQLNYDTVENLTLTTGPGNDTVDVRSTPAGTAVTVNPGAGNNTLVRSTMANTWNITGLDAGDLASASIAGPVTFGSCQNLMGGGGTDTFVFGDGAGVSGNVTGGSGGANTLDYSAYTTSVYVNLQTFAATGVGGV